VVDPDAPTLAPEYIPQPEAGDDAPTRVAVVGCDWDNLRAVDLLAVLQASRCVDTL
jgi:hypothetical protein